MNGLINTLCRSDLYWIEHNNTDPGPTVNSMGIMADLD